MILLTDGVTPVSLPGDLQWVDEPWSPVQQSVDYSVTGALLVESAEKQAGRPITLQPPAPDMAWREISRALVLQVLSWAQVPGQQLTLTLEDFTSYTVIFRHPGAVEAQPVKGHTRRQADERWRLTLRLMVI